MTIGLKPVDITVFPMMICSFRPHFPAGQAEPMDKETGTAIRQRARGNQPPTDTLYTAK